MSESTDANSSGPGPTRFRSRMGRTAELVRTLAIREVRLRYRQSLLNVAWALVTPVVVLVVYGTILTQGFDVSMECGPYLSSAWAGLVIWTFFATALSSATGSLISSAGMVTKVYMPLESLPLASVVASLVDLGVGLATLAIVLAVQRVTVDPAAVVIALPLAVLVIWTAALSIVAGVLAAFARDVVHAVALILRVGFFATPIMYDAQLLPRAFAWSASINPIGVAISAIRDIIFCRTTPDLQLLGIQLFAGIAALVGSVLYVQRIERRVPDVI